MAHASGALPRAFVKRNPGEDEGKKWQNALLACAPPPLSPPVHTSPPPPSLPRKFHSCRPGPTSLAAWARWVTRRARPAKGGGVPKHLSGCHWLFGGSLGPASVFCTFRRPQHCARRWRADTPSPSNSARAHAQSGWLVPSLWHTVVRARVPPICPSARHCKHSLPSPLSFFCPQIATGSSPGPPYQARGVRRCRKSTEQCHCERERRRRPGQGRKV